MTTTHRFLADPMPTTNVLTGVDFSGFFRSPIVLTVVAAVIVVAAIAVLVKLYRLTSPIVAKMRRTVRARTATTATRRVSHALADRMEQTWPDIATHTTALRKKTTHSPSALAAIAGALITSLVDAVASLSVSRASRRSTHQRGRTTLRRITTGVPMVITSVDDDGVRAELDTRGYGNAPDTLTKPAFLEGLAARWNVPTVVARTRDSHTVELRALHATPAPRLTPGALIDPRSPLAAVDSFGDPVTLDLSAGPVAVHGTSSDRTGFVQSLLAQLARHRAVQFLVMAGKTPAPAAAAYAEFADRCLALGDDTGRVTIAGREFDLADLLTELVALRRDTLSVRDDRFWNQPPTTHRPLIVLVIDDYHQFFGSDRRKATLDRITALRDLLVNGSEYGIVTILTHAENLPTRVREVIATTLDLQPRTVRRAPAARGSASLKAPGTDLAPIYTFTTPPADMATVADATRDYRDDTTATDLAARHELPTANRNA